MNTAEKALRALIERHADFEVVGEAASQHEAVQRALELFEAALPV